MKLYGSLTSPYVRKVRIALIEKGLRFEMAVEGPADAAGNVRATVRRSDAKPVTLEDISCRDRNIAPIEHFTACPG